MTALAPATLTRLFHETYERLAPSFGYETRKASAKPWAEVPAQNKELMTAVAAHVLASLQSGAPALAPATAARLGALADQLTAEAVERLPFGSGELAEALAQAEAVRALAGPAGGSQEATDDHDAQRLAEMQGRYSALYPEREEAEAEPPSPPQRAPQPRKVLDLMAALKASLAASEKAGA